MKSFEVTDEGVVWGGEYEGAIMTGTDGVWYAFRYFSNAELDIEDGAGYASPEEAFERAKEFNS